jgi:hypothetical protein
MKIGPVEVAIFHADRPIFMKLGMNLMRVAALLVRQGNQAKHRKQL